MKEFPIIFSASMINAILDGRKTTTRQVTRPEPNSAVPNKCPYAPGDRLWVQEPFGFIYLDTGYALSDLPIPAEKYIPMEKYKDQFQVIYKYCMSDFEESLNPKIWPSILMPKWASRLWLEIRNVKAVHYVSTWAWMIEFKIMQKEEK